MRALAALALVACLSGCTVSYHLLLDIDRVPHFHRHHHSGGGIPNPCPPKSRFCINDSGMGPKL